MDLGILRVFVLATVAYTGSFLFGKISGFAGIDSC